MLDAGVTPPRLPTPATPEQQHIAQEQDAARTSRLFAVTNAAPAAPSSVVAAPTSLPPKAGTASSSDPTGAQNMQENKLAFANAESEPGTVSPARIQKLTSPYVLQAGWVINAALVKGIKTDLPGGVRAQVGLPITVTVDQDLILAPYREATP